MSDINKITDMNLGMIHCSNILYEYDVDPKFQPIHGHHINYVRFICLPRFLNIFTWITSSTILTSKISGIKPAPIPWILCGPSGIIKKS